ncbi:Zn-dependent hydrolase [Aliidongia dinghuensis]|uniref:Zn-dependent hydrolase n=1 Tax=Aliidongia dinghuensis TaxID=1867774 RepID=A0A8J2YQR3_9PROT|nr:Zn-dependent hydrolase [Aliidongia dinghuensis]GGF06592.1 Zn-dependent hydrolase [Aliidongia dinghuensis]
MTIGIDGNRLIARLRELGEIGRDADGRLIRVALNDAEKQGRGLFVSWLKQAGLDVVIDRIGNIFGIWRTGDPDAAPIMLGSHIDTVVNAGIYDGCYGVLAGLEVIDALKCHAFESSRPIIVGAFTNEEGVRYVPDMMGSLVFAGGLSVDAALAAVGHDGTVLGRELARIGYAGETEPGFVTPHVYVELHIEQGPVLERDGIQIGAVENLQGISWQRITIDGTANHAGTTPMAMRCDAGQAAARVITFVKDHVERAGTSGVATVGTIAFHPNVINVIPSRATFTVDLRDPDEAKLKAAEAALADYLGRLAAEMGVRVATERLARFEPVVFDARVCGLIEQAAREHQLSVRRMTSGAGHDAQMIARICPAAMIFVPSRDGISHNPREHTEPDQLVAGANVLLDVVARLARESAP